MTETKKMLDVVFDKHGAFELLDPELQEVVVGGVVVMVPMPGDADCGNRDCKNNYCIVVAEGQNPACIEGLPNAVCTPDPPTNNFCPGENERCGPNPP